MRALLLALILSGTAPAAPVAPGSAPDRYATGQVWAYRTRAGDEGSLLKIQQIEYDAGAIRGSPIYHLSIIGIHFHDPAIAPALPHAPVSRQTLDASVTELAKDPPAFPDPAPGIAEWRRARGGVFTVPVAEIIATVDREAGQQGKPETPAP